MAASFDNKKDGVVCDAEDNKDDGVVSTDADDSRWTQTVDIGSIKAGNNPP